jgi:ribosomal protein S18
MTNLNFLEKLLDGKVIGQHDAVSTVAKAIKRARILNLLPFVLKSKN